MANNKRGFLQGDSSILVSAGAGFSNDGIVYGSSNAPSSITIASSGGGFANSATGIVIAGGLLDINTASFSNAADNVSAGVGSLGNARLRTTGAWDAGANPLKVNGLLTANTNGIFVDVGKTWEGLNVKWSGTLTNLGTTRLGTADGAVTNQSTGGQIVLNQLPNQGALVGSFDYISTPPVGYTAATFVGYTDVLNRAVFIAGSFTGSVTNIAGDVTGTANNASYNAQGIAQAAIWSGVPLATPGGAPQQILVAAASLPRANLTGTSTITLTSPGAGTVTGANVTINAGDLTVDRSHISVAQNGITAAQTISVGTVLASVAGSAGLQSLNPLNPAALSNSALQSSPQSGAPVTLPAGTVQPSAQSGALSSTGVGTLVGSSSPLGSAGTFAPGGGSGSGAGGGGSTAGGRTGLALPAPNLATVQGAWAALMSKQLAPVVTDWAALNAQANAINTSNLTLNLSGKLTNNGGISATSNLVISATGGLDNSGGTLAAGEWLRLDSQGLGLINTGGNITAGKLYADVKGNVSNDRGSITATSGVAAITASGNITAKGGRFASLQGDLLLQADGQIVLAGSTLKASKGTAALYGQQGVTLAATQEDKTTSSITNLQVQTVEHAAVAAGVDSEAQAAYTEVTGGSVTTDTRTQTEWSASTVDAKSIDIRSGKGAVTIDASDLTATQGINLQGATGVRMLAQRGTDTQTTSTANTSQQRVGSWDSDTLQLVTTTTAGPSSTQQTLRESTLNAGSGTLSISANTGDIKGESAQLSGNKVQIVANAGNIDLQSLQSLQTTGTTVGAQDGGPQITTQTLATQQGQINAAHGTTVLAGGGITLNAQAINAGQGALAVGAGGNINLTANADVKQTDQTSQTSSSSFLGLASSSTTTHTQASNTTPTITSLKGQSVTVLAGDTLNSVGAKFDGRDSVYVEGKNAQNFYAVQSVDKTTIDSKTSDSFLGIGYQDKSSTDSSLKSTALPTQLISQQKVTLGVGNKANLEGTSVSAPEIVFTRAKTDTGTDTAANATTASTTTTPGTPTVTPTTTGELVLGTATNTTQTSHTEKTTTLGVWQAQSGQGGTDQTLTQTTLNGHVRFDNSLAITAQIPQGDLKTQITKLGNQGAGLDYLAQLASKPDIKWDQVATAHDQWSYSQQGLTPAGAALLAIVVAVLTDGMGSGLVGTATEVTAGTTVTTLGGVTLSTTTAATATAAASTTTFAAGAMLNAGFTTLVTSASTSFINNGGDIGKTLSQLGSDASVRSLVTSMLSAGAVNVVGANLPIDGTPMNQITASSGFTANLGKNLTNGAVTAVVDSALNGKPINAANIVANAVVTTTATTGANLIGDLATPTQGAPARIDAGTQLALHAGLGCAVGAATAGNASGCAPGAAGAVAGEVAANIATNNGASASKALGVATITSAATGVLVGGGGDNVAAVNIAAAAGSNAAANNFLTHAEATRRADLMEQKLACKDDACAAPLQREIDKLNTTDVWRDQQIGQACQQPGSAACGAWTTAIQIAAKTYKGQDSSNPLVSAERSSVLNDAFKYTQANNNPFLNGVGQGLLKLTPLGVVANTGVGAFELTTAILNNGATDTALNIVKGITDLPANIMTRLNSSDPAVRGEALVDALAVGGVATLVTGKLVVSGYGIVVDQAAARATANAAASRQSLATQINNSYRDGAPPAQLQQTFDLAAQSSTHNSAASEVILGKYVAGSSTSYEAVAQARGATYFSMTDWSTVQGQLGAEQMWNINKAFLDQQMSKGKSFTFTTDPRSVNPDSYTALEFRHLSQNGYSLNIVNGEYRVIKK